MCWNPQNRACFSKTIDLRDHMPRFTLKWMFSHLSFWKPHECVLQPSEQGSIFQDDQFEGSHAKVYSKNECFPIYLLRNPINVCWNPQKRVHYSEMIDLGVTCLGLLKKRNTNELFPIYLLGNPINVCWNPQNRPHFSKMINLRHHMPRFSLKTSSGCSGMQGIWYNLISGMCCIIIAIYETW